MRKQTREILHVYADTDRCLWFVELTGMHSKVRGHVWPCVSAQQSQVQSSSVTTRTEMNTEVCIRHTTEDLNDADEGNQASYPTVFSVPGTS